MTRSKLDPLDELDHDHLLDEVFGRLLAALMAVMHVGVLPFDCVQTLLSGI